MATPDPADPAAFAAALAAAAASQDRLVATLTGLTDADCRGPSALPGWTRGHLLTHVARNADGLANLATWAATGVETPMYASAQARTADIEAGSGRDAAALRADVAASAERLAVLLDALPAERLDAPLRLRTGARVAAWELPLLRRREVEIHHVDLAAGYTADDWPDDFVTATLDQLAPAALASRETGASVLVADDGRSWPVGSAGPAVHGPAPRLLEWLVGRGDGSALRAAASGAVPGAVPGGVPPAPPWA